MKVIQDEINLTTRRSGNSPTIEPKDGNTNTNPITHTFTTLKLAKRKALDVKVLYSLYCALSPIEYSRVSSCETAKKICNRLHMTFKGTYRVKETKTNILLEKYKFFKMRPEEIVTEMFTRFIKIINELVYQMKIFTPIKKSEQTVSRAL